MASRDLEEILESGLAEIGPVPTVAQVRDLATIALELERWAARINLTGHRDAETITRRLILDAAALLSVLPPFSSLADLGSGAGFPGLPLAVLSPGSRVVLVESRERRHFFQREIIRRLPLSNVTAVLGRFDAIEPTVCQLVVAQAVSSPGALAPVMRRWAATGGSLVVPGGEGAREAVIGDLSTRTLSYRVPLGGPRRTVWIAEIPAAEATRPG